MAPERRETECVDAIDELEAYVEQRRAVLEARLAERPVGRFAATFPACPSPRELVAQDLDHLTFLRRGLERTRSERRAAGPAVDLAPLTPPPARKAPLAWRALRWAGRRAWTALHDASSARRRRRARRLLPAASTAPTLSVLIPTYNRATDLLRTLAAYERQVSDLCFEVVVVDDGGSDGTAERLAVLRPRRYDLRFLRQDNAGPAAARNRALDAARAELVLITGDDIEPADDLLLRHWQAHRAAADPRVAVLGLTCWPAALPLSPTMAHIDGAGAQQFNYGWLKAGRLYDFRHFYTSNVSLRRDFLQSIGGFSTRFPAAAFEDAEIAYRLSLRGLRILYHPEARASHHHPYDHESFFRRQERCGAMAVTLKDLHPEIAPLLAFHDLELAALNRARRALPPVLDAATEDAVHDRIRRLEQGAVHRATALAAAEHALLKVYFHWAFLRGAAPAADLPDARQAADAWMLAHLPPERS